MGKGRRKAANFTDQHKAEIHAICEIRGSVGRLRIPPDRLAALDKGGDPLVAVVAGKHFPDVLPFNFIKRLPEPVQQPTATTA